MVSFALLAVILWSSFEKLSFTKQTIATFRLFCSHKIIHTAVNQTNNSETHYWNEVWCKKLGYVYMVNRVTAHVWSKRQSDSSKTTAHNFRTSNARQIPSSFGLMSVCIYIVCVSTYSWRLFHWTQHCI